MVDKNDDSLLNIYYFLLIFLFFPSLVFSSYRESSFFEHQGDNLITKKSNRISNLHINDLNRDVFRIIFHKYLQLQETTLISICHLSYTSKYFQKELKEAIEEHFSSNYIRSCDDVVSWCDNGSWKKELWHLGFQINYCVNDKKLISGDLLLPFPFYNLLMNKGDIFKKLFGYQAYDFLDSIPTSKNSDDLSIEDRRVKIINNDSVTYYVDDHLMDNQKNPFFFACIDGSLDNSNEKQNDFSRIDSTLIAINNFKKLTKRENKTPKIILFHNIDDIKKIYTNVFLDDDVKNSCFGICENRIKQPDHILVVKCKRDFGFYDYDYSYAFLYKDSFLDKAIIFSVLLFPSIYLKTDSDQLNSFMQHLTTTIGKQNKKSNKNIFCNIYFPYQFMPFAVDFGTECYPEKLVDPLLLLSKKNDELIKFSTVCFDDVKSEKSIKLIRSKRCENENSDFYGYDKFFVPMSYKKIFITHHDGLDQKRISCQKEINSDLLFFLKNCNIQLFELIFKNGTLNQDIFEDIFDRSDTFFVKHNKKREVFNNIICERKDLKDIMIATIKRCSNLAAVNAFFALSSSVYTVKDKIDIMMYKFNDIFCNSERNWRSDFFNNIDINKFLLTNFNRLFVDMSANEIEKTAKQIAEQRTMLRFFLLKSERCCIDAIFFLCNLIYFLPRDRTIFFNHLFQAIKENKLSDEFIFMIVNLIKSNDVHIWEAILNSEIADCYESIGNLLLRANQESKTSDVMKTLLNKMKEMSDSKKNIDHLYNIVKYLCEQNEEVAQYIYKHEAFDSDWYSKLTKNLNTIESNDKSNIGVDNLVDVKIKNSVMESNSIGIANEQNSENLLFEKLIKRCSKNNKKITSNRKQRKKLITKMKELNTTIKSYSKLYELEKAKTEKNIYIMLKITAAFSFLSFIMMLYHDQLVRNLVRLYKFSRNKLSFYKKFKQFGFL